MLSRCSTANTATKVEEDRTQKLSAHVDLSNAAAEKKCQRHRQSVFQPLRYSATQSFSHAAPVSAVGTATWLLATRRFCCNSNKILINHKETREYFVEKSAIAKGASATSCSAIVVRGDSVSGIFKTPYKNVDPQA